MKLYLSTLFLSLLCITLFAQNPSKPGYQKPQNLFVPEENVEAVVEEKLSRIDLVGFQYEKAYSKKNTVVFGIHSDFLYPYLDDGTPQISFGILPKIELSNRYFYGQAKRKKIGKPYKYNTGPYIAGKVEVQNLLISFQSNYDNLTTAFVGLLWGFQNNEAPLTINFEVGPGFGFANINLPGYNFEGVALVILAKLKFGFLLNKPTSISKYDNYD